MTGYGTAQAITTTEEPTTMTTTEASIAMLTQVFDNARNAIIDASNLASTVSQMRGEVETLKLQIEGLQRDLSRWQERNAVLEEHLVHARRQRDDATVEANSLRVDVSRLRSDLDAAVSDCKYKDDQISSMSALLEQARKERDDAELRGMELEEENKKLHAKLAAVRQAVELVGGNEKWPEEPKPVDPPSEPPVDWGTQQPRDPATGQWR